MTKSEKEREIMYIKKKYKIESKCVRERNKQRKIDGEMEFEEKKKGEGKEAY